MKKNLLLLITVILFAFDSTAQCTISGTTVNASSITCTTFNGCSTVYIGNGTDATTLVMNANLSFPCLGAITFVIRNNASIDFSDNNKDLTLPAGSSLIVENGGSIGASGNCSASDLIKIGTTSIASCNGGGSGVSTTFPVLVTNGGYNVVTASATSICGTGASTITASMYPAPTAATTYKLYTDASGGTALSTTNSTATPYSATFTTSVLSSSTTYYVEAITGAFTTQRKPVTVVVNNTPSTPTVTTTQPNCSTASGAITITAPTGSGITYSINGSDYTNTTGVFNLLSSGTYNVTAKNSAGCISAANSVTINTQPTAPVTPTLGTVIQPTCATANGSFSISNYNAAYTYAVTPSTGVTVSGSTVTAPVGTYTVTATSGSCTSTASLSATFNPVVTNTWNGSTWSTGVPPTANDKIIFAGNYSSSSDITGCSCQINSGNIVINSGNTLTVTNDINVSGGSLTFEDSSSLLQISETAVNTGNIIYKRTTTPLKQYDYTYWSSPVANATLAQLATNSLFYSYTAISNNWVRQYAGDAMVKGKGYIGRAPSGLNYSTTQIVQTNFIGTPNNGTITTPFSKGAGILNLIGNPYPSAIDIDLFLTDPANAGIVNGTIYLWTHNTAISSSIPGNHTYNYTVNDYAKYNLTGGTKTASSATTGDYPVVPTGKIAAGQGFFIDAHTAMANGTQSVTFKNSMRVQSNNTQFFRTNQTENNTNSTPVSLEKHRVWISLSNTQGGYNEALVGYIQEATNEMDRLFDGKTLPSENVISVYSMLSNDKLSIQGRSLPFAATDIVPLGYTTTLNGQMSITLENFDGLFANQDIYLWDRTTGIYHDLKASAFTFTTTSGTFNNRFELRFTTETLGIDAPLDNSNAIRVIAKQNQITVLSGLSNITSIEVHDLTGKSVYSKKGINTNEFNTDAIPASSQMLIVKVTLDNKQTLTKKVLIP
ncbi:hypothetical protein FLJC2902T_08600 [Flavobacterium limnosediminis JC2902]|uniref:Ig-like domain-containing protein n=1 Tax=Flavobacterium limnosediminis JC2902 TaxID=1341181 RepID=V6SS39_9FLAO|nr:T9SS sorting signal type C domain-containing protein [Flavobacterium limnosediminis]ESU29456.1 hypothetical protein FLJC2902T_08600 [Flavobacterium limnosediminis JC2902]